MRISVAINTSRAQTAFLAGVVGALAMSVLMTLYRARGLPFIHVERRLGEALVGSTGLTGLCLGTLLHLAIGGTFALIYARGFVRMRSAGPALGSVFGLIHWLVIGLLFSFVPVFRVLFSGLDVTVISVIFVLGLHLIYGWIVGTICRSDFRQAAVKPSEFHEDQHSMAA